MCTSTRTDCDFVFQLRFFHQSQSLENSVAISAHSDKGSSHLVVLCSSLPMSDDMAFLKEFNPDAAAEELTSGTPASDSQGSIPAGQTRNLASEVAGLGVFGNEEQPDESGSAEAEIERLVQALITEGSVPSLAVAPGANEDMFKQALHVRKGSPAPCQQVVLCKAWLTPGCRHRLAKPHDHNMWAYDVDTSSD